jgi:hypothetical protein
MLAKLRTRISYANVMATLAVFIALGGSSYATLTITGKDVKNSSLTGSDVKDNSLTGADVKGITSADVTDRSLLASDFKAGQLPAGPPGAPGQQGQQGAPGQTGAQGPAGPTAGAAGGEYDDPPADPSIVLEHATIHMSASGRIYAMASIRQAAASCAFTAPSGGAFGNCTMTLGLYVDGEPVPKSTYSFGVSGGSNGTTFTPNIQAADFDRSVFGVSTPVPAGDHEIQLSGKVDAHPNNGGTTGSPGPNAPNATAIVGGIALGG